MGGNVQGGGLQNGKASSEREKSVLDGNHFDRVDLRRENEGVRVL